MSKMTAAEAGRKGGASRSCKKLAACRKNGFQPATPLSESEQRLRDLNVEQWLADAKLLGLPQEHIDRVAGLKAAGEFQDSVGRNGDVFPHPFNAMILVAKRNATQQRKEGE